MKKIGVILLGFVIAIVGSVFALYGVSSKSIEGSDGVTLFLGSVFLGIVISQLSRISELSIAGNVVKLRETVKEAHDALLTTFKLLLSQAKKLEGGFRDDSCIDSRIDFFWELYEHIKNANLESALNEDISETAKVIASCQKHMICSDFGVVKREDVEKISPEELKEKASSEATIADYIKRCGKHPPNPEDIRQRIEKAVDEYEKLLKVIIQK